MRSVQVAKEMTFEELDNFKELDMGHTSDEMGINIESNILWYHGNRLCGAFRSVMWPEFVSAPAAAITRIMVRRCMADSF
jgi:hypothetical protein